MWLFSEDRSVVLRSTTRSAVPYESSMYQSWDLAWSSFRINVIRRSLKMLLLLSWKVMSLGLMLLLIMGHIMCQVISCTFRYNAYRITNVPPIVLKIEPITQTHDKFNMLAPSNIIACEISYQGFCLRFYINATSSDQRTRLYRCLDHSTLATSLWCHCLVIRFVIGLD